MRSTPQAHGPGYAVPHDIVESVCKQHKEGILRGLNLQMFKLEDIAMGIWIEEMKKKGSDIKYVNGERIHIGGCEAGYVLAHYQESWEMLAMPVAEISGDKTSKMLRGGGWFETMPSRLETKRPVMFLLIIRNLGNAIPAAEI
ncbi:beta-1,3-galactosyltransferase GALT1-like [Zingiber officinale]|nr:beta-1,3-galactosyltransferase GALT1-like [Zingiber officinale]